MAEVSQDMILDYMIGKGGVVKNVDLVRHFRKFLQLDDPLLKGMSAVGYQTTVIMFKGMRLCHNGQCVFEVSVVTRGQIARYHLAQVKTDIQLGGSLRRRVYKYTKFHW